MSLAGRTVAPAAQPVATRIGSFGGIEGLAAYLRAEHVDILIDALHPFAARMACHAREAARLSGCRLIKVSRAPWAAQAGDRWQEVDTTEEAVAALGIAARRVFLTIGSLRLDAFADAPQHYYLIRTIDPVVDVRGFPDIEFLTARGPFDISAEEALMRDHRVDVVVTKNSGGTASAAKLVAARRLGIPVVLLRRPSTVGGSCTVAEAVAAIAAHGTAARRGV